MSLPCALSLGPGRAAKGNGKSGGKGNGKAGDFEGRLGGGKASGWRGGRGWSSGRAAMEETETVTALPVDDINEKPGQKRARELADEIRQLQNKTDRRRYQLRQLTVCLPGVWGVLLSLLLFGKWIVSKCAILAVAFLHYISPVVTQDPPLKRSVSKVLVGKTLKVHRKMSSRVQKREKKILRIPVSTKKIPSPRLERFGGWYDLIGGSLSPALPEKISGDQNLPSCGTQNGPHFAGDLLSQYGSATYMVAEASASVIPLGAQMVGLSKIQPKDSSFVEYSDFANEDMDCAGDSSVLACSD